MIDLLSRYALLGMNALFLKYVLTPQELCSHTISILEEFMVAFSKDQETLSSHSFKQSVEFDIEENFLNEVKDFTKWEIEDLLKTAAQSLNADASFISSYFMDRISAFR